MLQLTTIRIHSVQVDDLLPDSGKGYLNRVKIWYQSPAMQQ